MTERPAEFAAKHRRAIARLYAKALAAIPALRGHFSEQRFADALCRSAAHQFPAPAADSEVENFLNSLHATDLALAAACAEGHEAAWDFFVREYRPALYAAGRAIAGESAGRELADSIYAELFGLEERDGRRRSLFDYFHGRSKLSTWLRAVLAQRHVDAVRAARRLEPLELEDEEKAAGQSSVGGRDSGYKIEPDPERARYVALLQDALTRAIAELAPRERLRLSYYYVQDLTLAQIGRLLGEHEASVSRHLASTRKALRRQVERELREERRLSEAQLGLCYEYAVEQWPFDLTKVME